LNITIIGSGYVGLVTGVCLAAKGHEVACVDLQEERINKINNGEVPFFEPGLSELLRQTREKNTFVATLDLSDAVRGAQIIFVAVGTPSTPRGIDLSAIEKALASVGELLGAADDVKIVVIKSTVVPGTSDTFARQVLERSSGKIAGKGFLLASNPEFLREGRAVDDFMNPDRIIIGTNDARAATIMRQIYNDYDCPLLQTSTRNAELTKYASNALLATLVSFSNELAGLCEQVPGADLEAVMEGLHLDKRLSPSINGERLRPEILSYLSAGPGFGGSCLPKDAAALLGFAEDSNVEMPLLRAALSVNSARAGKIVRLLEKQIGELRGRRIALLGLAFKPGTDDLRDSPALRIASALLDAEATVSAFDPVLKGPAGLLDLRIAVHDHAVSALQDSDAAVLVTAWPQFAELPWEQLTRVMRRPFVLDCRGALRNVSWPAGTQYTRIGTGPATELSGERRG